MNEHFPEGRKILLCLGDLGSILHMLFEWQWTSHLATFLETNHLCFFSFLSVEVMGLGTFQTPFPVFSVLCFAYSLKNEIHANIIHLARLFGWCNHEHRNTCWYQSDKQQCKHLTTEIWETLDMWNTSRAKKRWWHLLWACTCISEWWTRPRGKERPAAQFQCPT